MTVEISATFDQLLAEQRTTARGIKNIILNSYESTKKSKQSLGSLRTRLSTLNDYWADIGRTHQSLMKYSKFEESDYAKNEEYKSIYEGYIENKPEL